MAIKFLNTVQVDTDVLYVDAAGDRVGVGTDTPAKKFTVVEEGGEVRISTVSADTPQIQMIHNPLPNDGNGISNIIFSSVNDATQSIGYASIKAYADDVTDGTEDGSIRFATMKAGAIDETLTLKSGNVGVGTTSPSTKLEISSSGVNGIDISQSASNATQSGRLFFSTNTASEGFALFNSNGTLQINSGGIPNNTSGTNRISILSNGNVGVGTTSPDYKLEVDGTLGVSRTDGIIFAGAAGTGTGNKITSDTSNDFIFSTALVSSPYTSSERMRIDNGGNVGIGTTGPSSILHIEDTTPILKIVGTGRFDNSFIEMGNGALADAGKISCFNNPGLSALELKFDNGSTGDARIRVGQRYLDFGIDGSTAMYVNSSKNVGIGTTSPQAKLHVASASGTDIPSAGVANGGLFVTNTNNTYGINMGVNGSGWSWIQSQRSDTNTTLYNLNLQPLGGNVGINDTTPSYKLDVNGEGRFTGDLRCLSLIQTSQSDKKQSIAGIVKTKAKTIEFKEYVYKSDGANRKRYGVLAEDIEDDYPELVHVDAEGVKGINYIDLLVKRVAELEKELEDISLTQGPKGDTGAAGADGNSHLRNISSMAINSKTGQLEIKIGKSTYKFNPDK